MLSHNLQSYALAFIDNRKFVVSDVSDLDLVVESSSGIILVKDSIQSVEIEVDGFRYLLIGIVSLMSRPCADCSFKYLISIKHNSQSDVHSELVSRYADVARNNLVRLS